MPLRNPLDEAMQELVGQIGELAPSPGGLVTVPFGKEGGLSLQDRANRTFGPNGMSPQERRKEWDEMVVRDGAEKAQKEMVNRARAFQRQQRPLPQFRR